MDDPENGGVSNAAIRLFDWVRDPSNNGSVYPNDADAATHTVREGCPYSPKRTVSSKKKRMKKNGTHPISW